MLTNFHLLDLARWQYKKWINEDYDVMRNDNDEVKFRMMHKMWQMNELNMVKCKT